MCSEAATFAILFQVPPPLRLPEPLVDGAVPADGLPQLFGGLLGGFVRGLGRARYDLRPDAPRVPVVVGDVRVHDGQALFGLFIGLASVGDETTLGEEVGDGPVGHLYRPLRVIHKDPLDLRPLPLEAVAALIGERFYTPFHAAAALSQLPLGLLLGAPLLHRALV